MANQINSSTLNILKIFDLLLEEPIEGLTLGELTLKAFNSKMATARSLYTLEAAGWVESYPIKGCGKLLKWKVSDKFLKAAYDHRDVVLAHIADVKLQYKDLTGKDL